MNNLEKEIIINESYNETRVAIIENKKLVEMHIERADNTRTIGNIYAGVIDNVVPGMNSVFVDINENLNGFSHLSEFVNSKIDSSFFKGSYKFVDMNKPIEKVEEAKTKERNLKKGDKILVQVVKESIGTKGPRITTNISIPGRYIVLIPNDRGVKISKRIYSFTEKRRLKKIVNKLVPENFGVIIRTAAQYKKTENFSKDIIDTYNIWKDVAKKFKNAEKATLLYQDYNMAESIVRDLFTTEIKRIVIDSKELYLSIKEYVTDVASELSDRIEYHSKGTPIFDEYYNINKEYYTSLSREVFLKKGGSIVFDHTEALVAIDVNSKRYVRNKSHEENSLAINLSAAREIARQLRLRDLGGLIIIDFIDMLNAENKVKVFNELKEGIKCDKAKISIEPISRFGLIEMTRQRLKPSIVQTIFESCSTCAGKGIVRSKESVTIQIDRWLKNYRFSTQQNEVEILVNQSLYDYLLKGNKNKILISMIKNWIKVNLTIDNTLPTHRFRCLELETKKDITKEFLN